MGDASAARGVERVAQAWRRLCGIATAVVAALVVVVGVDVTAVINLVAGVAVISLLTGVGSSAMRRSGPVP